MSRSAKLGAALYNTETEFGEVATTFATRVPIVGQVDVSGLVQQMILADRVVQLRNEITPGVKGVYGGSFKTRHHLTGHGSTCAGAITLNTIETLLGIVIGNVAAAGATGTTCSGTGTASAPGVAAATGFTAGALVRIGALGDGDGNGQFVAVSSHAASVLNLLTAVDGAPANGAVVYNPANIYPTEDPTANNLITGTRWLLQGANLQYEAHGCYPRSISLMAIGETGADPSFEVEWGVSWFRPVSTPTFPSATSVESFPFAPVANGSLFLGNHGDPTRLKEAIRSLSINIKLGIVELRGPGGAFDRQVILGCARIPDEVTGEFVIDSEDATANPALATLWETNSPLHLLYTWSCADATAGGIYLPRVYPSDEKPTQFDMDGLNRVRFKFRAGADNTKSTALERAAYRIASA